MPAELTIIHSHSDLAAFYLLQIMAASVKYMNQSVCRANQRINVWVLREVSLQMLQSGPTLQQTIQ
jgi:hypothetical protein